MHRGFISVFRWGMLALLIAGLVFQQSLVSAAGGLSVTPITWNVMGLDSNNPSVGPNHFPVGMRVCNQTGASVNNVSGTFVWDAGGTATATDIYTRPGTLTTIPSASAPSISLANGACTDFYYEVEINRASDSYDKTRRYHVEVTSTETGATKYYSPMPREVYVEHLISQNRNYVSDVKLDGVSVPPGGTMNLMVGQTYNITVNGNTATQGYNQLEEFIDFPNTIFQVLSVSTVYSADNSPVVPPPYQNTTMLYGNACTWDSDPTSPTYRSCIGGDYKNGGSVDIIYSVKILKVPSAPLVNPEPLSTLIYDFSGSSYHYNADYGVSTRYANIINAGIVKAFSPKTITPNGNSTLTFTITNPGSSAISNVKFNDAFPSGLTLNSSPTVSYSGCGSPSPAAGVLTANATSLSFSTITVLGNSSCTITVTSVTSATAASYTNTTGHLLVNATDDTGNFGTDSLLVTSGPGGGPSSCTTRTTLATWDFASAVGNADSLGPNVTSAITSSNGGTFAFNAGTGSPATGAWSGEGWSTSTTPSNTAPYFEFTVDAHAYGDIGISYNYNLYNGGTDWGGTNNYGIYYAADGTNFNNSQTGTATKGSWQTGSSYVSGITTSSSQSKFRINFWGAKSGGGAVPIVYLDHVVITGCAQPNPPTLSKSFSAASIGQGNTTTLTFTIQNPNGAPNNFSLNGISFSDVLPSGLSVADGTASVCGGTNNLTTVASTRTITLSTTPALAAGGTCTFNVTITGSVAGQYHNITTNISSTDSGSNSGGANAGYGDASITVVGAPVIAKSFTANPIYTGSSTTLNFNIVNPNASIALSGVTFTDVLPTGLSVANGTFSVCGGTNNLTTTAATREIALANTTTIAAGGTCTFSVSITGSSTGSYTNTTGNVSSTNGGTGNTATANVLVKTATPAIHLLKQVGPTASGPWTSFLSATGTNVYYRFTVENTGDVALSSVNVTDPPGGSAVSCSWTNGNTPPVSLTAPFNLPVADANDSQIANCVLGPVSVVSGLHTNTALASGTNGTTVTHSSSATYGTPAITLAKSVTETSFTTAGDVLHYSYLVTNSGSASLLGPVTVSDNKTTVTCPTVSTVGDGDAWLDPTESLTCTATYIVTGGDVTAGFVTNTATATVSGVDSNTANATVGTPGDLTVTKTNDVSSSVAIGSSFNWTINIQNLSGVAIFTSGQTIMSDTLPGVAAYYPQGALTVTNGSTAPTGTVNCSITGTASSCVASGGSVTLPANASFSTTFAVTPTTAGLLSNTAIVDSNANITELNEANNSSTNTVTVVAAPSISKSFSPNPTVVNVNSTLTFTITDPNAATILNGVAFSDTYPTGLVNVTPLATTNNCGGTLTATAGGNSISLSGGTIAANSSCTISVSVVPATGGNYANISGNVSSINGGTGNAASSTLAAFDAQPSKSLVTTSELSTGQVAGTDRVTMGEMVRYRLVTRIPEGSFTNIQLIDGIPNGLQFLNDNTAKVAFVCNSGASCMTSSTLSGAGLVTNGVSSNVSPTFAVPGAAISGGSFGSGTDITISLGNITNSDADADSEYIVIEFNALVLNINSTITPTINQGINNLTAANISNNRQNDVTLRVNGLTIGSASPNVTVDIAEPAITSIAKSVLPAAGPYLPGDTLTYTLTFGNFDSTTANNTNATTAFDIVLSDTFDSNLVLGTVNVSSTQGATCAGGTAFTTSNSKVGQLATVNVSCLDPGKTVTATVNATIDGATTSGTTIANSSSLTYTSLPGAQGNCATAPFTCTGVGASGSGTGERNGSNGPGADDTVLNNYAVTSNTVNLSVTYGSITIVLDSVPNNAQDFGFTGSGPNGYNFGGGFSLDDDADPTLSDTRTFIPLVPGSYAVTQGSVSGWSLAGLTCIDPDNGSTVDLGTATATIDLDAGENIMCTYTDTQLVASIVLTKTPTLDDTVVPPSGIVDAGDAITYTFSVQNTGNVTITNINVTDPLLPTLSCTIISLAPGGTSSCTATNNVYTLTQADIDAGSRANTATVTGKDPSNNNVSDPDTKTVTLTQNPALTIVKNVTETSYANVGDVLHYSYLVTNSGNVTLSGPFTVTDDKSTDETCPGTVTLAPGASITCNATYIVTGTDITNASVTNIASAHGFFGGSPVDSATDSETVNLAAAPAIVLTKTPALDDTIVAPSGVVNSGDTITYAFSVQNTGNETITNINVTDPLLPTLSCAIASLAPGTTLNCTATNNVYTLIQADIDAGTRTNTATATGKDPNDNAVSDPDTKTTTLPQAPSIALTKTPTLDDTVVAPSGLVNAGDTIIYSFSVQNTGNVTITNINVTDPLLPTLSCMIASLVPGANASCTPANNVYTLTQSDINTGSRANTATATGKDPNNNDVTDPDTKIVTLTQSPSLDIVKEVSNDNTTWNDTSVTVNVGDTVYYRVRVSNTGNTTLTGLTVDDGMAACTLVRSTDITGNNDNNFEVGEEWAYTCSVTAVAGTNNNTATADTSETPQVSDTASYVASTASVADPALTKAANPLQASVGDTVTFTLKVTNKGNAPAPNVVVTDALPSIFDVTSVSISGAPIGTLVDVTPLIGTGPAPYTVVVTVGSDLAVADVVTIQIVTKVNSSGNPPINNSATLTTSASTDILSNDSASVSISLRNSGRAKNSALPATGFAKEVKTMLGPQPSDLNYSAADVMLEIPSLGVKIPIVGVPQKDGTWNLSWLENQAGWLQGTAFPSWSGNSVLTGHVYMASGLPGPFINLSTLKYGDTIIVHAYGQKYTFAAQTNTIVAPDDQSVMKHEDKSWVTLITCKDYDEKTKTYLSRVVVRAVLVRVDWDK